MDARRARRHELTLYVSIARTAVLIDITMCDITARFFSEDTMTDYDNKRSRNFETERTEDKRMICKFSVVSKAGNGKRK